jgi:Nitrate and nitrite sensing/Histidine kinase-, DNA gyrase B-, and HSP90-like ATPase
MRHRRPVRNALLRIRNWRVRQKLAAVLIIPTVAFIVVGGLDTARSVTDAVRLSNVAEQTAAGDPVASVVHELQRERDRTAGYIAAVGTYGVEAESTAAVLAALLADTRAVDAAIAESRRRPAVGSSQQRIAAAVNELAGLRAAVRGGGLRQRAVFDQYTQIIGTLLDVLLDSTGAGAGAAVDAGLAQDFRSLANLYRVEELEAQIRGRLYAIATARFFSQGEFQAVADLRAQRADAIAQFRAGANEARLTSFDNLVKGQATLAATRIEQAAVDRSQAASLGIDPEQWWSASTTKLELVHSAVRQLFAGVVDDIDGQSSDQQVRTALGTLVIVLILLVAVLTSLAIGRSMVRTLGSLRAQAHTVARQRLPEVVRVLNTSSRIPPRIRVARTTVDSLDEIGEVADAFDAVHREAVRLAAEQADLRRGVSAMFVSLARRSQALVERQLGLIDSLEEVEEDPDLLANLFKLDHLATRMRRTNDNLLVIAGAEALRRSMEPVDLADVLLAAMAEIEQYTRVRYVALEEIAVIGHAAPDLVHLLAELIDNATAFSPPHSTVQVTGRVLDGGAVVTVEDNGVGMSPKRLAQANHRLARPGGAESAVPEQMGLYVVANLGARHGIRTELRHGVANGVVAVTWIPGRLLTASAGRLARPAATSKATAAKSPDAMRRSRRRRSAGIGNRTGMWWSRETAAAMVASREGEPANGPRAAPTPATQTAVAPTVNDRGLPIRVPMAAHSPRRDGPDTSSRDGRPGRAVPGEAPAPQPPREDVEPERDSAVLAALYRGIREADEPDGAEHTASPRPVGITWMER